MFGRILKKNGRLRGEAGWADLGPDFGRKNLDFKFVIGPEPAWKNVCYGSRGWKNMCLLVLLIFPPSRGSGDNGTIKKISFVFSTSKIILVEFLNRF